MGSIAESDSNRYQQEDLRPLSKSHDASTLCVLDVHCGKLMAQLVRFLAGVYRIEWHNETQYGR
jgi:hypothetical protein